MGELIVKYNELTAEQFIELRETVWGDGHLMLYMHLNVTIEITTEF